MKKQDYVSSVIYKSAIKEEKEWRKEKENRQTVHTVDEMLKKIRGLGYKYKYFADLTNRENLDEELLGIIEDYIPQFSDAWVVAELVSVIGLKGRKNAAKIVLECYSKLTDEEKRLYAVYYDNALKRIGDKRFIPAYLELLKNPQDAVKLSFTMTMLGRWKVPEAKEYFIAYLDATILYLNTSVSDLVFTSIDALSYYDDPDGNIKTLIQRKLLCPDKDVVTAAKRALKRMNKQHWTKCEILDKVKTVIDEWDPIELLSMHCPPDEYDDISIKLSQVLICNVGVEYLEKEIYNLFVQAFGIPTFDKSMDDCRIIAQKILNGIYK